MDYDEVFDYGQLTLRLIKTFLDLFMGAKFALSFNIFIKLKKVKLNEMYEDGSFTGFNHFVIVWTFFLYILTLYHTMLGLEECFGFILDWG